MAESLFFRHRSYEDFSGSGRVQSRLHIGYHRSRRQSVRGTVHRVLAGWRLRHPDVIDSQHPRSLKCRRWALRAVLGMPWVETLEQEAGCV